MFVTRLLRTVKPGRFRARAFVLALVLTFAAAAAVHAAPAGRIQGKIVSTDTGEPIGFADVLLIPADTTMRRVGGFTNADGTFLLEAAPGRYRLQIRAISYTRKIVEGIVLEAGGLLPFNTALASEAIQQDEIVVEAKARQNTEASLLSARKKSASVGDAISAEQVRKSPDKDAAEVLRRVTGLSVSDGKFVFVRGLGERYSSTEVDGVRLASPEQNKRVVPLDLLPASLLDNIVVQKTYTADRPGEFGGGDVQVRTKDFPGARSWQFTIQQGFNEGVTFEQHATYQSSRGDIFGFGADFRKIPDEVYVVAGDRPLALSSNPEMGFDRATLAGVASSFKNIWTPYGQGTIPNGTYSATFGDEFRLFGRPLGVILSGNLNRSYSDQDEAQRVFSSPTDTLIDYAVSRWKESVQLGGISALSYRLSPRHTLHLRGLYTNSAEDEVRHYEGVDHNRDEPITGTWLVHRNTRLMYVQRNVMSAGLEGRHDLAGLLGTNLNWKLNRSRASRLQPDRREVTYDRRFTYDETGNLVPYWTIGSVGSREYGDLQDDGWGATLNASVPYRLGALGAGKLVAGYDHQAKERDNFYRRFNFYPSTGSDLTQPPDTLFGPGGFPGTPGSGYVEEGTLDIDNYYADQEVAAAYLSADVPLGSSLRGNFGVRVEHGVQEVTSFDLFFPDRVTAHGRLDNQDVLPSANLTWAMHPVVNLRLAASRTVSRPDLNELSPSPALEYVGGFRIAGNPELERATIENYDVRVEAFPSLSEVVAAGFFYKAMHEPIEQVIQGGSPMLLVPRNSDRGFNRGIELEANARLGRFSKRLESFSLNTNATFISSEVVLKEQVSKLGSQVHPLQGQANYLLNAALTYTSSKRRADASILFGVTGERLATVAVGDLGDIYEQPTATLDATLGLGVGRGRLKLSARNLLDPEILQLQSDKVVSSFRRGRSYSVGFTYPS